MLRAVTASSSCNNEQDAQLSYYTEDSARMWMIAVLIGNTDR